jgi:hypothetical protein
MSSLAKLPQFCFSASVGSSGVRYQPDVDLVQYEEGDDTTPAGSPPSLPHQPAPSSLGEEGPRLHISTLKVCTQVIDLPEGVSIQSVTMAAGHLSSSSIYPACFAPYLLSGACTDGRVRFWRCQVEHDKYAWTEWEMMIRSEDTSAIRVAGKPLHVSCAYSGRVAVAYRMGAVRSVQGEDCFNLFVSIYECESSGECSPFFACAFI